MRFQIFPLIGSQPIVFQVRIHRLYYGDYWNESMVYIGFIFNECIRGPGRNHWKPT